MPRPQQPPRPMRAAGFTDPSFARLADLAHLLAGLVFPANRQPSAEAGMRRAMSSLRISNPAELLRAAESPGPSRDAILAELTVGESYFFRDEAQLRILGSDILPARLATHGAERPLRVWSAGCASGEEPYTVAIMLKEFGWPHAAEILGTDVATPRLVAARRGRYTRWALRGVSEQRVESWFRRAGNYFELNPAIREAVEFRELNLVHDEYGAGGAGYDLVLCRNVMIYFDFDTVARIATRLLDSLDDDGWLVLGASDPPLAHLVPCEAQMTSAGMAYRRARPGHRPSPHVARVDTITDVAWPPQPVWHDAGVPVRKSEPVERIPVEALPVLAPTSVVAGDAPVSDDLRAAYDRADYLAAETMAIAALATALDDASALPTWILYVRAVANQGRLADAGELCARALEAQPMSAELHYLHAMLLAESGWHADAAIAARRSIYLDRAFVVSHLLLGDVLTRTGDADGARRAFENVVHLVGDDATLTPLVGADGVPAPRLRQIAQVRLRGLTPKARQ